MGDRVESLAEVKVDNIHCSPLRLPSQSCHCRKLSDWSSMISPW